MDKLVKCVYCGKMHKVGALYCPNTGKQIPRGSVVKFKPQPTIPMNVELSPTQPIASPTPAAAKGGGTPARVPTPLPSGKTEGERCPFCGGFHKKGSRFCPITGEKIFRKTCPACEQEVILKKVDARFCPLCGASMVASCPYPDCRKPLPSIIPFCPHCFRKIRYCSSCRSPNAILQEKCTSCLASQCEGDGEWLTYKGNNTRSGFSRESLQFPLFIKWSYPDKVGSQVFLSSPIVWRGILFIGDNEGNLSALNQYSGKLKWARPTKGPVISTPAIDGGSLFVANADGKVFALDADNGKILWVFPRKREEMASSIKASILAGRGKVYVATSLAQSGEILSLEASSGTLQWKFSENEASGTSAGIQATPALTQDILIVASNAGFVYGLNADSGKVLWRFPKDSPLKAGIRAAPAVSEGIAYVGDRSGKMFALKVDTGEDTWHFSTEIEGSINSSPSLGANNLFVGTWAEYFYCLDKNAGGVGWSYRNEKITVWDAINQSPLVLDNKFVLYGSSSGYVYTLDMVGNDIWKYRLESEIISTPVVSDGFLYVVTASGVLYAFYPRTPKEDKR